MEKEPLISDLLIEATEIADLGEHPMISQWVSRNTASSVVREHPLVNEKEALEKAEVMIGDLDDFIIIPDIAIKIQDRVATVIEDRETYLHEALCDKKVELRPEISGPSVADIEKSLRNQKRGFKRKIDLLEKLVGEHNNLVRKVEAASDLNKLMADLAEATFIPERLEELERENNAIGKTIELIEYKLKVIKNLSEELSALELTIIQTEQHLRIVQALESFYLELCEDIENIEQTNPGLRCNEIKQIKTTKKRPQKPKKKKKKKKRSRKKNSNEKEPTKTTEEEKYNPIETSIDKLKQAISIAANNKIFIILQEDKSRASSRFLEQWETLIRALGFQGEITVIGYNHTKHHISDPVIIPKGMFTHVGKKLKKENLDQYFVIDIGQPNILANYIKSKS